MFEKIKDFFSGKQELEVTLQKDQGGTASDRDLHVATAVLLFEIAGSDQEIARTEGRAVVELMSREFGISEQEIPELVETAIEARKEQGRIDQFVQCINQRFSPAQRQRVLAMLWRVIIADGKIDKYEQRLATQMKFRFQLTDDQANEARSMAELGMV